ncbi:MAG: cell division protein FtsZ [Thermodesulfobacteriota bacterium]|nr:cell division protein FtsZ [Thermodesulfobacteriota bacterium]
MFELEEAEALGAQIKVIGVGGCGCNAVNNMINSNLKGVEFIALNTDIQTLRSSAASQRVQVGTKLTRGLGAGGSPEVGTSAATESEQEIHDVLQGADMIFITSGLGGGTGTGASPVVARIAREMEILTVAVVTKPFPFEGKRKMKQAEKGESELSENVDALIIIPNNRLLSIGGSSVPMLEVFKKADEILINAVKGISDLINDTGLVNVDFNDVKAVMSEKGKALMGIGVGRGETRAVDAAQSSVSSPLLEDMDIQGAKGLLINITGGMDITMDEVQEASSLIQAAAHEDANIIWGVVIDENITDEITITVVATGFSNRSISLAGDDDSKVEPIHGRHNTAEVDYDVPSYVRNNETHDISTYARENEKRQESGVSRFGRIHKKRQEREIIRMGRVVDEDVLDDEIYNVPTFLRKKAD